MTSDFTVRAMLHKARYCCWKSFVSPSVCNIHEFIVGVCVGCLVRPNNLALGLRISEIQHLQPSTLGTPQNSYGIGVEYCF